MSKKQILNYDEAVAYLFDIPRFTNKNTMEDTKAFLHRLKDPDKKMRIIHVAGTNGKGSVCAYMRSILEEAGYTTCVFTSPHLVDVRERFLVKGQMPGKKEFLDAFLYVYEMLDFESIDAGNGYHPTFFEYMFFMGMVLFEKADADFCILETGLGGRLDATNSVSRKILSVITSISLEHVEYLGDTLEKIAGEKAGIIKEGAPVVFADNERSVAEVFCRKAKECGTCAIGVSKADYKFLNFKNKSIDFSLQTEYYGYVKLSLSTPARYQMENASLAVRALEVLDSGKTIKINHIVDGVKKCKWQGRMEEILPEIFVDGAHNADGLNVFLDTVRNDGWSGSRSLLFGVVKDKDYVSMIQNITASGLFDHICVAPLKTGRSLTLHTLQETLEKCCADAAEESDGKRIIHTAYEAVDIAVSHLINERKETERIYVAGSLYLVGEVKSFLTGNP